MVTDNGSEPLKSKRHEAFCKARVAGNDLGRAWTIATGYEVKGAVQTAYRAQNYPQVAARIAYLRSKRQGPIDSDEVPTKVKLAAVFEEITTSLMALHTLAIDCGADYATITSIKRAVTAHIGRVQRRNGETRSHAPETPSYADMSGPLTRLFICKCQHT